MTTHQFRSIPDDSDGGKIELRPKTNSVAHGAKALQWPVTALTSLLSGFVQVAKGIHPFGACSPVNAPVEVGPEPTGQETVRLSYGGKPSILSTST